MDALTAKEQSSTWHVRLDFRCFSRGKRTLSRTGVRSPRPLVVPGTSPRLLPLYFSPC